MKRLTYEEYNDRVKTIAAANKIFGELTDNNMTRSFEAYQLILADHERSIFLSTQQANRRQGLFDSELFDRPECPECGRDLLYFDQTNEDSEYNSLWRCYELVYPTGEVEEYIVAEGKEKKFRHPKCSYELFSEKTMATWMEELRKTKVV